MADMDTTGAAEQSVNYSDGELVALVGKCWDTGTDARASALANESFYFGERPKAADTNTSDYVSMAVFDGVEDLKAKMLRTFCSNRDVVRFNPDGEGTPEMAQVKTKAVQRIFHHDNNGYKILHDAIHDAFVSRLCAVRVGYRERKVSVPREFSGLTREQIDAAAAREDVVRIDIETEQAAPMVPTPLGPAPLGGNVYSGTITVREDRSKVVIEVLDPLDVRFSSGTVDISNPERIPMVVTSTRVPRYQLLQDGFDPQVVDALPPAGPVDHVRRDPLDMGVGAASTMDMVEVREAYAWLDYQGTEPELWQIIVSGAHLLAPPERLARSCLRFWTPHMIPHRAIGIAPADVLIDGQVGESNTIRGWIDNVQRVNTGVRTANLSLIRNPSDLIENPIGGIIDTSDPVGAISVAAQPALSPATGALLEIFQTEREQRTGSSRLSRGLQTQDVLTHQNSADMINQLIDVSSDRPMMLARSFAELFLKPLLNDVWAIAVEEDVSLTIEVNGRLTPVRVAQLPPSDGLSVDVALTPDQGDTEARRVLTVHTMLAQDPQMAPLYGINERYRVYAHICGLLGMPVWMKNPADPQVQQQMQQAQQKQAAMEQLQMQIAQKQLELREREVRVREAGVQIKAVDDQRKHAGAADKLNLDATKSAAKQNLDAQEFAWRRKLDVAEYALEDKQDRPVALGNGYKGG